MIAASRPGSQPMNLQGIWNDETRPPWSSNFTININTEMNYWPAETANLAELHEPLLAVRRGARGQRPQDGGGQLRRARVGRAPQQRPLAADRAGRRLRRRRPGVGVLADGGRRGSGSTSASTSCSAGTSTSCGARAYPVMKAAAEFCLDWLIEDGKGHLVTSPSTSPEHKFLTADGEQAAVSMASTMDMALIRDLFANVHRGRRRARASTRRSAAELEAARRRLLPYRIGAQGQLLGVVFEEFEDPEPQHRHFSHLFGLHPGRHITWRQPGAVRRRAPLARDPRRRRDRLEPRLEDQPLGAAARRRPRLQDDRQAADARRHRQRRTTWAAAASTRTCSTRTRPSRSTATSARRRASSRCSSRATRGDPPAAGAARRLAERARRGAARARRVRDRPGMGGSAGEAGDDPVRARRHRAGAIVAAADVGGRRGEGRVRRAPERVLPRARPGHARDRRPCSKLGAVTPPGGTVVDLATTKGGTVTLHRLRR